MKISQGKVLKNGDRQFTVTLKADEKLLPITDGIYYKLGYPFDDIVHSHIIEDAVQVHWCPLEQKWV